MSHIGLHTGRLQPGIIIIGKFPETFPPNIKFQEIYNPNARSPSRLMGPDFGPGYVLYFMYISSFKPKPTQDVRDRQTDRQTSGVQCGRCLL